MTTPVNSRPFTARVRDLRRQGLRYADLEARCGRARSTAWFNNLVNATTPWVVGAPPQDTWERLAKLMSTTATHVAEMVAEEWYGVRRAEQSDRVAALAPRLDALDDEDVPFVEQLIQRLLPPDAAVDERVMATG